MNRPATRRTTRDLLAAVSLAMAVAMLPLWLGTWHNGLMLGHFTRHEAGWQVVERSWGVASWWGKVGFVCHAYRETKERWDRNMPVEWPREEDRRGLVVLGEFVAPALGARGDTVGEALGFSVGPYHYVYPDPGTLEDSRLLLVVPHWYAAILLLIFPAWRLAVVGQPWAARPRRWLAAAYALAAVVAVLTARSPAYGLLTLCLGGLLVAIPVARAVTAARWRQRAEAQQLCLRCGYDLRATPDRCPECGAATAEQ